MARAKALGLNPQTLMLPFAKAYLLQRKYQKVLDEAQPGPQSSASNTAQLLKYRGDANWGLRHFKEACDLYGQSSKTDAQKPEAYWGLAECAARIEHDMPKSRGYLDQALRLGQRQDETWVLIGNWESAQGKSKEAESAYAHALKLNPKNTQALFSDAMFLLSAKQFDAAKNHADTLRKISPDSPAAIFLDSFSAYLRKDYPAALDSLQKLEKRDPNLPSVLLLEASVNYATGTLASSEQYVDRYLAIYPRNIPALKLRIKILLKTARAAEAVKALQPLLAQLTDQEVYVLAAEAYSQLRQYAQAVEWLEKAAKANPAALEPRAMLARYYLGQNKAQQALVIAREAQTAAPDNPAALDLLGSAQLAAGEKENALASFNQILARYPNAVSYLIRVASIQGSMGHPADARATLTMH